jgi:methionyl-tRNA synthetase
LAAKLNPQRRHRLQSDDFMLRVNSDLVGKYVNIASRAAGFLTKRFDGKLTDKALATNGAAPAGRHCAKCQRQHRRKMYESREYARPLREIMLLADKVNAYVDQNKPGNWPRTRPTTRPCTKCARVLVNAFRLLTIYLKPVLPALAASVETFLNSGPLSFATEHRAACGRPSDRRIPAPDATSRYQQLDALFEAPALVNAAQAATESVATAHPGGEAIAPTITIDDFAKVDLRIAAIVSCEAVEGSTKLLRLTLDVVRQTTPVNLGRAMCSVVSPAPTSPKT